jgi:DNA repair photolyase
VKIRSENAGRILSPTSGFIAESGFTHSLTPARNCTFGCTYCYVPTMRVFGGLRRDDWERWGQFTTFKANAADLLRRELKAEHRIYCSPLVDPYQPAEVEAQKMPRVLDAVLENPPRVFTIQTRGPLILRDLDRLRRIRGLRVSFSVTTNREDVQRWYEPLCASIPERLAAIRALRDAGVEVYATLSPLLPCDPEELARMAMEATGRDLIGDPLHVRSVKPRGATTREAARKISEVRGFTDWLDGDFQNEVIERIRRAARDEGKTFETGPQGFARLAA